jgi:hypothetical protein
MAMPDRKFPWIWTAWLFALVVSFAVIEGCAIAFEGTTLSRFVWELTLAWPLLPWIGGGLAWGLAVHFWWHWSPPGSSSEG